MPGLGPRTAAVLRLENLAVKLAIAPGHAAAQPAAAAAAAVQSYESYMSQAARDRQPNALRALYPLLKIPGILSLGNGQPNPGCFPFEKMTVTTKDGTVLELGGGEMADAIQYADTIGTKDLRDFLGPMMADEHTPPPLEGASGEEWGAEGGRDFIVTIGSQDALAKTLEMLCERGDTVLTESPSYPGALGPLKAAGVRLVGIPVDEQGLVPELLEATMVERKAAGQPLPKVVYLIPHGQNPSGSTMSRPGPPGAFTRPSRSPQHVGLVRRFCMGD
jgi:DNA-binding transcriptional MocR family regulator